MTTYSFARKYVAVLEFRLIALIAAITMSAPTFAQQRVDVDTSAMANVHTIALRVDPPVFRFQSTSGAGAILVAAGSVLSGGILTAAATAGAGSGISAAVGGNGSLPADDAFKLLASEHHKDFGAELTSTLKQGLEARGYSIKVVDSSNTVTSESADALLSVTYFNVGYSSPAFHSQWNPALAVQARLNKLGSDSIIYASRVIAAEQSLKGKSGELINVGKRTAYPSVDAILQDFDKAADEMSSAQSRIGQHIVDSVSPPKP